MKQRKILLNICIICFLTATEILAAARWMDRGPAQDAGIFNTVYKILPGGNPYGNSILYNRDYLDETVNWKQLPGLAFRVDVDDEDNPWVLNKVGDIFRLQNGTWKQLPARGKAQDIAVGGGSAFLIGPDVYDYGGEIFKWNARYSYWELMPGLAGRVAAGKNGRPWVVNKRGDVFEWNPPNNGWIHHPGIAACDIAVGPNGTVFAAGRDGIVYYFDWSGAWLPWDSVPLAGLQAVSVDRWGVPWVVAGGKILECAKTLALSTIQANLDSTDLFMMKKHFQFWDLEDENLNISTNQLIDNLRKPITLLYHTGRGDTGFVETADWMIDQQSTHIKARNVVWATCRTLADINWMRPMTRMCDSLSGYTDDSFDKIDNAIVDRFVYFSFHHTIPRAWYLANNYYPVADRWITFVSSNDMVVEFSARSGWIPPARNADDLVPLGPAGKLYVAAGLLQEVETRQDLTQDIWLSKPVLFDQFPKRELEDLEPVAFDSQEALRLAESFLQKRNFSDQRRLDKIYPIITRKQNGEEQIMAWCCRYNLTVHGAAVRNNGLEPYAEVAVTGNGRIWSYAHYWPKLKKSVASRNSFSAPAAADLLRQNAAAIESHFKGDRLNIVKAEMTYGYDPAASKCPASMTFYNDDGLHIVVNLETGDLL